MPCTIFKTLTINFIEPVIKPIDGYFVKWRTVGDTAWNIIPNQFTSPIIITGVPACGSVEGVIQADCGGDNFGNPISFVVPVSVNCMQYKILETGALTYIPCDGTPETTIDVTTLPFTICAVVGSVSGLAFNALGVTCNVNS